MGWDETTCCNDSCTDGSESGASWDCPLCCKGEGTCADITEPDPPGPGPDETPELPGDFSGVVWLHKDVSGWPQTASLSPVSFKPDNICLTYDKTNVWPGVIIAPDVNVNANPWIFVYQDGTWYAATWEWLRVGQTCKASKSVAGDHIKKAPLKDFKPVAGQTYYFMVSGLARLPEFTNVQERSNPVKVVWPEL